MTQEIKLDDKYLSKLFSFYFYRNTKILRTIIYLAIIVLATLAYFIVFLTKLNYVISQFDGVRDHIMNSIYLITILVVLFIISGWLIVAYIKLYNTSRVNFIEEIIHTYPKNSLQNIEVVNGTIISKNSVDSHQDVYNLTDISIYYVFNKMILLQTFDNNFIFLNNESNSDIDLIKINIKKKHFLRTLKKES